MKNWVTMLAVLGAVTGCAADAGDDEELDGGEARIEQLSEQGITQHEKDAITAKAAGHSYGAPTSDYAEYSGGVRRKFEKGVIMFNRSVDRAETMERDQYNLWTWIGKGAFGWPNKNTYTLAGNSKIQVSRGAKGYILSTTDNVTDDAWPLMTNVYGSIPVSVDSGTRSISVFPGSLDAQNVDVRIMGSGFPPSTSVMVGISLLEAAGTRKTVTTTSSGAFDVTLLNVSFNSTAVYNGVTTVWARTSDKESAAVWSGWVVPPNTGIQAQNAL